MRHGCGGTILRGDIVLTAAHCCFRNDQSGTGIEWAQAGGVDVTRLRQNRKIVKYVIYPKYDASKKDEGAGHDLCLLKVVPDFNVDNRTNMKVSYAKRNDKVVKPETKLVVAGWGRSNRQDEGLPENPAELMYIVVSAINQTECRNRMNHIYKHKLKHHKNLTDNLVPENLCTRQDKGEGRNSTDSGQDSCQGDSGGPLLLQEGKGQGPWGVLVGVVSWGPSCALKDAPAVYVDVHKYAGWIDEEMKKL